MSTTVVKSIRYTATAIIAVAALAVVAVLLGAIPLPWKLAPAAASPPAPRQPLGVELVPGQPYTLHVPREVCLALGILKGDEEMVAVVQPPTEERLLVLAGSTALDPTRLNRIRIRFAPADVVKLGETEDPVERARTAKTVLRDLRPGDRVEKGQLLAVVYSVDVGTKKNDLIDALVQLKLDLDILDRAEKAASSGAVPEVFLLTARRNVEGDRNNVARAENILRLWGIEEKDIQAVRDEAKEILRRGGQRDPDKDKLWPRVELKAPASGTIVERNVAEKETIVDNTVNIFQIANVDRMLVLAYCPEDDLPILENLEAKERKWVVNTVSARESEAIEGPIEEVGYLIDPSQHTALIKGYIPNPGRKIRAGQYATATIRIPPPRNKKGQVEVVQIPIDALVEDGQQSIVFVETDREKHNYTMRRVQVTHRFAKTAFVQCLPIPKAEQLTRAEQEHGLLPKEPLHEGERVLLSGIAELKATLLEKEAEAGKEKRASDTD
jgi:cobalt-zinc-cadmium efflux system membrane fusion protein